MKTSFTEYLIKRLKGEGYTEKTMPEAKALEDECDTLLTYSDGMSFRMACIIDRETKKGKGFAMSQPDLLAIGTECLKYAGKVNSRPMPILLQVIEVSKEGATPEDIERLSMLKTSAFSKVLMTAWVLEPKDGTIWSNTSFLRGFYHRSRFRKMMTEPRKKDEEIFQPAHALPENPGKPLLTYAMLALFAGIFAAEILFPVAGHGTLPIEPGVQTLVAFGASSRDLVLVQGQWWRLFTAMFLHGGFQHILYNGIAFYFAGLVLETMIGRTWMFGLFVFSGFCGSLFSVFMNDPNIVAMGASGAIMGMLGAALIFTKRLPPGAVKMRVMQRLMGVFIPSLLPFLSHSGEHIDFSAHLGGALFGLFAGFVIDRAWPRESATPGLKGLSQAAAIGGLVLCLTGAFLQTRVFHEEKDEMVLLIPENLTPTTDKEWLEKSTSLVAQYPHDPRGLYFQGLVFVNSNQFQQAEAPLRAALSEKEILEKYMKPEMELTIRGILAGVLAEEKKLAEAKEIAKPVCEKSPDSKIGQYLKQHGLCN